MVRRQPYTFLAFFILVKFTAWGLAALAIASITGLIRKDEKHPHLGLARKSTH